jgi:hypothetical protein
VTRWSHLLSGAPVMATAAATVSGEDFLALSEVAALKANLARVEHELSALKAVIAKICVELGIRV